MGYWYQVLPPKVKRCWDTPASGVGKDRKIIRIQQTTNHITTHPAMTTRQPDPQNSSCHTHVIPTGQSTDRCTAWSACLVTAQGQSTHHTPHTQYIHHPHHETTLQTRRGQQPLYGALVTWKASKVEPAGQTPPNKTPTQRRENSPTPSTNTTEIQTSNDQPNFIPTYKTMQQYCTTCGTIHI
mmetsp:Transcript_56852/g.101442  ORF Transcript_56852/g.101442 Transcript_56852/m.101442 type:complete len:183 (-) Transcript_56852:1087-1635(-)